MVPSNYLQLQLDHLLGVDRKRTSLKLYPMIEIVPTKNVQQTVYHDHRCSKWIVEPHATMVATRMCQWNKCP